MWRARVDVIFLWYFFEIIKKLLKRDEVCCIIGCDKIIFTRKGKFFMAFGQKYHVSLREDGKWQVKGEKAGKALKLFDTQKAAIAYAETIADTQEGGIVIHKKDGKIRKQDYSKPKQQEEKE